MADANANVHHGNEGAVAFGSTTYAEAVSWEMTIESPLARRSIFGGGGYTRVKAGDKTATGTVTMAIDTSQNPEDLFYPGMGADLTLTENTGRTWQLYARFGTWSETVSAEGPENRVTVNFESDGVITKC